MNTRTVRCPSCGATASVPAGVFNVRCGGCGHAYPITDAVSVAASPPKSSPTSPARPSNPGGISVGGVAVFGGIAMLAILGLIAAWLIPGSTRNSAEPATTETTVAAVDLDRPVLVQPTQEQIDALEIAKVDETFRRQIYDQFRDSAVTTIEKPLPLPDGPPRDAMERSLQAIHDNSMRQLLALHDISAQDLDRIIAEGDLLNWDPSPRSRARRGGVRLYPDERTYGWKGGRKR